MESFLEDLWQPVFSSHEQLRPQNPTFETFHWRHYWDYPNPEFIIYLAKCNRCLKGILQNVDNLQKADNAVAG